MLIFYFTLKLIFSSSFINKQKKRLTKTTFCILIQGAFNPFINNHAIETFKIDGKAK